MIEVKGGNLHERTQRNQYPYRRTNPEVKRAFRIYAGKTG